MYIWQRKFYSFMFVRKITIIILGFCSTFSVAQNAFGDHWDPNELNTITTAVPFLMIAPDTRSGGMGDVGVASSPDLNSQHFNPAKYAFIQTPGISISYSPWLSKLVPDINLSYLAMVWKFGKKDALATSLRYFSLGNITFTDIYANETGQFNPNEFAWDVSYSRLLSDNFSMGVALRWIHSNLTGGYVLNDGTGTKSGNSAAADIALYYQSDDKRMKSGVSNWNWGMNISNIGSKISYSESGNQDFIPINFRTGISYNWDLDKYNRVSFLFDVNKLLVPTQPDYSYVVDYVTASGDTVWEPEIGLDGNQVILSGRNPEVPVVQGMVQSFYDAPGGFREELREYMPSLGVEYWYNEQFALRTGYFYEHPTKGNRQYFTLGVSLKYSIFGFDFSYLIPAKQDVRSPLENTLRFSLNFEFDSINKKSVN